MKLRFTTRAFRDLTAISDYIREQNPSAADRVGSAIESALTGLTEMPEMGRRQAAEGVRKLLVPRYPYLVYYRADRRTDEVVILSVRHQAQEREYRED